MIKKNCIPGGRRGMSAFWTNERMNLPKRTQRNDSWLYNLQLRTLLSSNSTLNFQGSIAIFSREPFSPFFISTNIKLRISPPSSNLCPRGKFLFRPPLPSPSPSLPLSLSRSPLFFFSPFTARIYPVPERGWWSLSLSRMERRSDDEEANNKKRLIRAILVNCSLKIFSSRSYGCATTIFLLAANFSRYCLPLFPLFAREGEGGKKRNIGTEEGKRRAPPSLCRRRNDGCLLINYSIER